MTTFISTVTQSQVLLRDNYFVSRLDCPCNHAITLTDLVESNQYEHHGWLA
jgi:hypothetical protein